MRMADIKNCYVAVKKLKIVQLTHFDAKLIYNKKKSSQKKIPSHAMKYKCNGFFPLSPQIPKNISNQTFRKTNYPTASETVRGHANYSVHLIPTALTILLDHFWYMISDIVGF